MALPKHLRRIFAPAVAALAMTSAAQADDYYDGVVLGVREGVLNYINKSELAQTSQIGYLLTQIDPSYFPYATSEGKENGINCVDQNISAMSRAHGYGEVSLDRFKQLRLKARQQVIGSVLNICTP